MIVKERPKICVSRCLGFKNCRYNGGIIKDASVDSLKKYVDYITVCPECDIGLSTPRDSLRIVEKDGNLLLLETKSSKDYSAEMAAFSKNFSESLIEIDAFILKSRSPSCGIKDVKIYSGTEKSASSRKGKGIFTSIISKDFTGYPIEDEGRLYDFKLRESFFTKLFLLSEFRALKRTPDIESLLDFHSRNKLLLNSYNMKETKELGRIVANHQQRGAEELLKDYEPHLRNALLRSPRYTSNINILQHAFGYFSKYILPKEKEFILNSIEKYRAGHLPLSTPLNLIKSYIIRFDIDYLKIQSFFDPYPEDLVEMRDSGKAL